MLRDIECFYQKYSIIIVKRAFLPETLWLSLFTPEGTESVHE